MYIFYTVLHLREDTIIEFIFCFYLIPRLASDDQAVKAFGYFDYKTFKALHKNSLQHTSFLYQKINFHNENEMYIFTWRKLYEHVLWSL